MKNDRHPFKAEPVIPVNTGPAADRRLAFPGSYDFSVNIRFRSAYNAEMPVFQKDPN
jgi:hypothetical protein